jgi:hypothetical protein
MNFRKSAGNFGMYLKEKGTIGRQILVTLGAN